MKKKIYKILCLTLAICLALCGLSACGKTVEENSGTESTALGTGEHPQVKFTMENGSTFTVELYPEYAPETVENFLKLVNDGFYNGLTFHRVVSGFMAQGGDPSAVGKGGFAQQIKGEFSLNGFTQNTLSHTRGVISMARSNDYNSATSQFFICYSDDYTQSLDGRYAAFGKVIEGMETVDAFLDVQRTSNDFGEIAVPVTPIVMQTAEQITAQ